MNMTELTSKWSRLMRLGLALAMAAAPICIHAQSQHTDFNRYTIVDLGPVGASTSEGQPFTIDAHGIVSGEVVVANPSNASEYVSRAVLGNERGAIDIGLPGLGGPNSVAYGLNDRLQAVGQADTRTPDPNGEDFCGSTAAGLTHSGNTCEPFFWEYGWMFRLPRLLSQEGKEGSNGVALQINDFGLIAGAAEDAETDATCPGASVSPQNIKFKPVVWDRRSPWSEYRVRELPTVGGDPDGIAASVNARGEVVGSSGDCGPFNSLEQNNLTPLHAILWRDGKAVDLGNLGGDGRSFGIFASGLNERGEVVGTSDTTGDASFHGFVWREGHIADLGTVAGDANSLAVAIGRNGLILGVSISSSFTPRAALWRDGTAVDMNTLVPTDTTLYLESACSINDKGEIIGFAYSKANPSESHAFVAKPDSHSKDGD